MTNKTSCYSNGSDSLHCHTLTVQAYSPGGAHMHYMVPWAHTGVSTKASQSDLPFFRAHAHDQNKD